MEESNDRFYVIFRDWYTRRQWEITQEPIINQDTEYFGDMLQLLSKDMLRYVIDVATYILKAADLLEDT